MPAAHRLIQRRGMTDPAPDLCISEAALLRAMRPPGHTSPASRAQHDSLPREDQAVYARLPSSLRAAFAGLPAEDRAFLRPFNDLDIGRYVHMTGSERRLFREFAHLWSQSRG